MKKILMIAGDRVEEFEFIVPQQALQMLGFQVDVTAPLKKAGDLIQLEVHDARGLDTYTVLEGHRRPIDIALDDAHEADYDALLIPGGAMPEYVRRFPKAIQLIKDFDNAGKNIACICHGAQLIAPAGIVKGKKVSCFNVCEPEITLAGGIWVEDDVVIDGNLITSTAYDTQVGWIRAFAESLGAKIEILD